MILESISVASSLVSMAKIFKEAIDRKKTYLPPLRLEYTYQEPHMLLRITNVSGYIVQDIR